MSKIRIGIVGYGNLGRGVEAAISQNPDMELVAVFTRRDPSTVQITTEGVGVYLVDDAQNYKDQIDVMILCGGSATDYQSKCLILHNGLIQSIASIHMRKFQSFLR